MAEFTIDPSTDPKCPYCGVTARRYKGSEIYPSRKDLKDVRIFACLPCDARVGVHDNIKNKWVPKGKLAGPGLRDLRMKAHQAFDPLWKKGRMSRTAAYKWLASRMGIDPVETHIGMFNEEQCQKVIKLVEMFRGIL